MSHGNALCIYEWNGSVPSGEYLLQLLFPNALRLQALLGESGDEVQRRLPNGTAWFAFHINLTDCGLVPPDRPRFCKALQSRGIRTLNAGFHDISKIQVQETCRRAGLPTTSTGPEGDPEEMLIVKTNRNYGGVGEARLSDFERRLMGTPQMWKWNYHIAPRKYVKPEIWTMGELVVERYIRNRKNIFYRSYILREKLVVSRVIDPSRIQKMPLGIARRSWFFTLPEMSLSGSAAPAPIHAALTVARFVQVFGLDYGALDLVQDDSGALFIIDVNTTPYWGNGGHPELLRFLASGLN